MQRLKAMASAALAGAAGMIAAMPGVIAGEAMTMTYHTEPRRYRQPGPPQPAGAKLARRAAAVAIGKARLR